jgi:ABC-type antimicrobial peptide transport system permease subunit
MNLSQTLKIWWEGLALNKVRSFLTTLGVIIGVGAVIIMLAISAGAEAEIADQINSLGANLIMVMPSMTRGGFGAGSRPPSLTYEDIPVIAENVTGISGVSAEQNTTQDVKANNTTYDSRVYVPITVVFSKFMSGRFGREDVRMIYVSAESKEAMEDVMAQLKELLMQILGTTADSPGFSLTTQDSIIDAQASTTETFRNLLGWVAGVSLIVGGIGIMNIVLVSVTERTREIGLRQALGARPRDVQLQFLFEAVMLSLIGGLMGVLLGTGGSYLFNALGTMRTELVTSSIPLAFGAAAAVGIFFGYYPATKAAQLDPIVALRHE